MLESFPAAEQISNGQFLELECNVLIPSAKEDQINRDNAGNIKPKIFSEGANGSVTGNADSALEEKGIMLIADILANAGGVTLSYFKWVQGRQGYFWTEERVNRRLNRMIRGIYA